jgi:hypothetical protein
MNDSFITGPESVAVFNATATNAKKVTLWLHENGRKEKVTELSEDEYERPADMQKDIDTYKRMYGSKLVIA